MDTRLLLISGKDFPVPECGLILHQPTIEEVSMMGEEDFFMGVQLFTLNKLMINADESVLSNTTDFQIFMMIVSEKETKDKKKIIEDLMILLLPESKVSFTPQSILITDKGGVHLIDENNFSYLQDAIKSIFCINNTQDQQNFNPSDAKAKAIAEKIMAGRKKVAQEKGQGNGSIFVQYISILSIGLTIPVTELLKYTVFQIYDSIQRYGLWVEYDLDIRTRLAGGTPQSQPENWMKNLY